MGQMAHDSLQAALDRLFAVPLEEFVAERTRLGRELKAGGERSAAEEIAALRKPTAAAWALNRVARDQPDAVEEWLEAAAALRDASMHPAEAGGDGLRAAMAAHRAATARLTEVVRDDAQPGGRPLSEGMLDRVRTLLASVTADARLAERLRVGRVTEGPAPTGAEPEPPGERPAARPRRRPSKRDAEAKARAARRAELESRVDAASEQVRRLRAEAARREAEAESADERLEEARRALYRAESEAAAAHDAVEDADAAAPAAERELHELRALLRRTRR
jgi:hypothetical protein